MYLLLLNFMTTPAVGGMMMYMRIDEAYQLKKKRPNYLPPKIFYLFLVQTSIIAAIDVYYLGTYSRRGLTIFPADYDPRTNFQIILYIESFMTPAVLVIATTIYICFMSYPLLIIKNLPPQWRLITKLVVSFVFIIVSFTYIAVTIAITIIGYEVLANCCPGQLNIEGFDDEDENIDKGKKKTNVAPSKKKSQ